MESFLQKWVWIAHLVIIALAAVLLATAFNQYVAIQLAPYTVPDIPKFAKASTSPQKADTQARARSFARPIVERCLFGCEEEAPPMEDCPEGCPEGEVCQAGACVPGDPNAGIPSELPVASDLPVKLLGAMVAANPDYSMALFSDAAAKATYILGVGEMLLAQAEIVDIRRDRVILRRNGRLEYIKLENSLAGAPTLTSAVSASPPIAQRPSPLAPSSDVAAQRAAEKQAQEARKPVREVAENTFELEAGAVESALADTQKLARGAKIVPNYTDGKANGIKLVGIRSDSVYSTLGIESGDVVKSINGVPIKNQAHAFELMQKLRGAKDASIEVERRGEAKKLKYRVK